MADADVPSEGEGFGCAFDGDGADAGAVVDVFDGDEFGFRGAVSLVEVDGRLIVRCGEAGTVEFVAQGGGQDGVGFRVGVEIVFDLAFDLFRTGEDGAADFEGVTISEVGSGLLLDAHDFHAAADFRVAQGVVDK